MSATAWAWLVLGFPLLGSIVIAAGLQALPARTAGLIGTAAIGARLRLLARRAVLAARRAVRRPPADRLALGLRLGGRARDRPRDPRRPALGLHVPGGHRRLDADPPLLGRLHGLRPRLRALLLLPQLLRLLDAAAGPRRQLRLPDRRLGVRRLRLLRADQLLVPARDRDQGGHEGLRDQRDRRHRPRVRRPPHLPRARHLRLPGRLRRRPRDVHDQPGRGRRDLPADLRRRVREVGAAAAPHLAPRRDGGPDPGLGADPRRDDGHRRRLPDRAHVPALRAGADRRRHRRLRRPRDAVHRGDDRARRHRPQADHRLLDHEPDRLHDRRRLDRRLQRRALPPDDARLLQGAAVHGRRLGDRGDGEQPEHRPDGRLSARAAVHLGPAADRRPGPRRASPAPRASSRRTRSSPSPPTSAAGCTGSSPSAATRRLPDRVLLVPDRLPGRLRRALPGGARARAGPPGPRRARRTRRPARPRTPTSASPVPSTTSPSASGRCASRWECSASWRSSAA